MTGADRVAAHLLEDLKLALNRADIERRAERTKIVMIAHAVKLDAPVVEEKAVGVESCRADAERCFVRVDDFVVFLPYTTYNRQFRVYRSCERSNSMSLSTHWQHSQGRARKGGSGKSSSRLHTQHQGELVQGGLHARCGIPHHDDLLARRNYTTEGMNG